MRRMLFWSGYFLFGILSGLMGVGLAILMFYVANSNPPPGPVALSYISIIFSLVFLFPFANWFKKFEGRERHQAMREGRT